MTSSRRSLGPLFLFLPVLILLTACGYTPVHSGVAAEKLHVVLADSKVPDAVASDEVLAGAREELARAGTLEPGDGFPRFEIEVLRSDEASEGIAAVPDTSGRTLSGGPLSAGPLRPEARATRVGLVARGWILRAPGGERERDTGDVRVFETAGVAVDARAATFRHSDALRTAGRRVGRRLATRIMGLPSATDE